MRTISRAVLLGSVMVMASSCDEPSGPVDQGSFSATWANKSWDGDASAYLAGNVLYLGGHKTSPHGYTLEYVSFEISSPATGTFHLGPGKARFTTLVGGDVIGSLYRTTGDAVGSVTITRYDGPGGIVEGTVRFDAELEQGYGSYGQRNRLRDGQFSATVEFATLDAR